MKSAIYNALAALNQGVDAALESLTILKQEGVLPEDYVQDESVVMEDQRAGLNHMIVGKLLGREDEDWIHFGRMKITIEERHKREATTTTANSGPDASRENGQRTQDSAESA